MSDKQFFCTVDGCALEMKQLGFHSEEVLIPASRQLKKLPYKAPTGELMRNFLVECPVHGVKIRQRVGHHVTKAKKPITP